MDIRNYNILTKPWKSGPKVTSTKSHAGSIYFTDFTYLAKNIQHGILYRHNFNTTYMQ